MAPPWLDPDQSQGIVIHLQQTLSLGEPVDGQGLTNS
jgi:hypothetical protein